MKERKYSKGYEAIKFFETINNSTDLSLRKETLVSSLYYLYYCKLNGNKYVDLKNVSVKDDRITFAESYLYQIEDVLKELFEKYSIEDLKFFAESLLLEWDNLASIKSGDIPTPISISELALKILDVREGEKIADFGSGIGRFLFNLYQSQENSDLTGIELNFSRYIMAQMLNEIITNKKIKFVNADVFYLSDNEEQYDKIFSNYPFSLRTTSSPESQKVILESLGSDTKVAFLDWVFNLLIVKKLKQNGIGVAITTSGSLFNLADKDVRKFFIENGYINTIIKLPVKMFAGTSIGTNLLILSHNNETVRMIDASDICEAGRRFNTFSEENIKDILSLCNANAENSKVITRSEISSNDYNLSTDVYLTEDEELDNDIELETVLLNIRRAAQISASALDELLSDEKTNYGCIMMADVQDNTISNNIKSLSEIPDKFKKFIVKDGDIIISKAPTPNFKAAVYKSEDNRECVANGNMYIISPNTNKIDPYYILAFFNSPLGKKRLNSIATGTVVRSLPVDGLKKIKIPYVGIDEQSQKANLLRKKVIEVCNLKTRLEELSIEMEEVF